MLHYTMLETLAGDQTPPSSQNASYMQDAKNALLAPHHARPPKHPKTPRYNANAGLSRSSLAQKSYSPTTVPSPIRIFSTVFPLTPFNNARLAKS